MTVYTILYEYEPTTLGTFASLDTAVNELATYAKEDECYDGMSHEEIVSLIMNAYQHDIKSYGKEGGILWDGFTLIPGELYL